jgi:hypothetical protein
VLDPNGKDTGYIKCADGTIHRAAQVACDPAISAPACGSNEPFKACMSDADCNAGPNGKCSSLKNLRDGSNYCDCVYSCVNDSDCMPGSVCVCPGVVKTSVDWSFCAPATCITDANCPSGECGITTFYNGCYYDTALQCRAPGDVCRLTTDCVGAECAIEPPLGYQCRTQNCVIGRPFVVDGEARAAAVRPRADWKDEAPGPDVGALSPAVRGALAAYWEATAALEHASVGSFARFTLQLLALGAPSDLLLDAQRAAADEVKHARMAFALASRYSGRPLGPSALPDAGAPVPTERLEVLSALIEEACVGETLGAAEAAMLAGTAVDPALRAAYSQIAEDERRHAELGWRTLRWILAEGDAAIRDFARGCFARSIAAMERDPAARPVSAPEHGLLSSTELGALRRAALRDVVRPCAEELLASLERAQIQLN